MKTRLSRQEALDIEMALFRAEIMFARELVRSIETRGIPGATDTDAELVEMDRDRLECVQRAMTILGARLHYDADGRELPPAAGESAA